MKKFIAVLALGGLVCVPMFANQNTEDKTNASVVTNSNRTYTVKACKFPSNGGTICNHSALYDEDANTLTVTGHNLRATYNPYYGDGSKKGEFEYCASGEWYFNN